MSRTVHLTVYQEGYTRVFLIPENQDLIRKLDIIDSDSLNRTKLLHKVMNDVREYENFQSGLPRIPSNSVTYCLDDHCC